MCALYVIIALEYLNLLRRVRTAGLYHNIFLANGYLISFQQCLDRYFVIMSEETSTFACIWFQVRWFGFSNQKTKPSILLWSAKHRHSSSALPVCAASTLLEKYGITVSLHRACPLIGRWLVIVAVAHAAIRAIIATALLPLHAWVLSYHLASAEDLAPTRGIDGE